MAKDKDLLKDLCALRKNRNELFKRPLVSHKKFLKIVTGQDTSYNQHRNLFDDLDDDIDISNEFEEVFFGEYLSEKIQEADLTLTKVASDINLSLESLHALLDDEMLPWHIPVAALSRLCLLLNLSKREVIDQIKNVSIDENNIKESLSANYAARSQDGLSSSKLKDALYDANVKIAIEREKEKRDFFIASFSKGTF